MKLFESSDKNYKIEMTRIQPRVFSFSNNGIICNFKIYTNIGSLLKEFNISDVDVSILLDNIYYSLECGDMAVALNSSIDSSGKVLLVKLWLEEYTGEGYLDSNYNMINASANPYSSKSIILKNKIAFCDILQDEVKTILSFDIGDNLYEFIDDLYYEFLYPNEYYKNYNPRINFNQPDF